VETLFAHLDAPLFLLTAHHEGVESGMIATWVMSSTLREDRSRIVAVLSPDGLTAELIKASRRFVLHLLCREQLELVPHFGLQSGRDTDKFSRLVFSRSPHRLPILHGTCGWSECEVLDTFESADRLVVMATGRQHQVSEARTHLTLNEAYELLPEDVVAQCEAQRKRDGANDRAYAAFERGVGACLIASSS
jgi:flavin reductase (DIM6/NTAB) family NADH-FMN oxidoreductase RutF